tara:strand:+ start:119 stop:637 length:519 start_codon:yes stop_codon:yes gene_type:complete
MASTIEIRSLSNIITNLNADLAVTSATPQVSDTCGTYALINQIISDLSSLKSTLKTAEKGIEAAIRTELELTTTQNVATNVMVIQTANIPTTCAIATKTVTSDAKYLNSADAAAVLTARKEDSTLNQNLGIKLNSVPLTESAILNGLAEAYGIINTIKNGQALVVSEGTNTS